MSNSLSFSLISASPAVDCTNKPIPSSWYGIVQNSELQCFGIVQPVVKTLNQNAYQQIAGSTPDTPVFKPSPPQGGSTVYTIDFMLVLPDITSDVSQTSLCFLCIGQTVSLTKKAGDKPTYLNVVGIDIGYVTKQFLKYNPMAQTNNMNTYLCTINVTSQNVSGIDYVYCQYDDTVPRFPTLTMTDESVSNSETGDPETDKTLVVTPRGTVVSVIVGDPDNC